MTKYMIEKCKTPPLESRSKVRVVRNDQITKRKTTHKNIQILTWFGKSPTSTGGHTFTGFGEIYKHS